MKKIMLMIIVVIATLMLIVSCSSAGEESQDESDDGVKEEVTENNGLDIAEADEKVESVDDSEETFDSEGLDEKDENEASEIVDSAEEIVDEDPVIKVIELTASNWEFTVTSADDIYEGDTVQMIVTGEQGSHGLKFEDLDVAISSIKSGDVETVEFVAPEAGEYRFYCSIFCGSGHSHMDGVLTVLEAE
jgi:cytochrome c oxidase subunit II